MPIGNTSDPIQFPDDMNKSIKTTQFKTIRQELPELGREIYFHSESLKNIFVGVLVCSNGGLMIKRDDNVNVMNLGVSTDDEWCYTNREAE